MHSRLSYGVMVAQQFLVLFVVVRIRLGQHNEGFLFIEEAFVVLRRKGKIVVVRIRLGQHNDGFLFIEEAFVVLCRKGENWVSGNLVGISINICKSIQKELFINDTP